MILSFLTSDLKILKEKDGISKAEDVSRIILVHIIGTEKSIKYNQPMVLILRT